MKLSVRISETQFIKFYETVDYNVLNKSQFNSQTIFDKFDGIYIYNGLSTINRYLSLRLKEIL